MRTYLHQQLRWNKSYYRELLWTFPFLFKRFRPLTWSSTTLTQTLLPLLLTVAVAATFVRSVVYGPEVLAWYAVLIIGMALLHCLYAVYRLRSARPLMFVMYGFVHAALLIPLRLRALGSLTDNTWGTRGATAAPVVGEPVEAPEKTVVLPVPMPVAAELVTSAAVAQARPRSTEDPRLVLVVDDERDVRELVTRKLLQSGFQVITAENGQQALEMAAAQHPDLMLLDVTMPGLSGFDVCRQLKAEAGDDAPSVIFLSARSQPEDILAGMDAGAEDYMVKPFSPAELVRRSVGVLERES